MNQPARSQARSAARLAAVQALYQQHMEGTALVRLLDEFHQHRLGRTIDDDDFDDARSLRVRLDGGCDIEWQDVEEEIQIVGRRGWTG